MNKLSIITIIISSIIINLSFGQYLPKATMCFNDPSIISLGAACNSSGDSCAFNSYCKGDIEGICTKVVPKGGACTTNAECSPYQCSNSICANTHFSIGNGACKSNVDCWTSQNPMQSQILECVGDKCVIPSGKFCTSPSDCSFNENCITVAGTSNAACVATSGVDGACSNRYDCNVNLVCSYKDDLATSRTCQLPWTKKLGNKCDNSTDAQRIPFFYDCDIASNLFCGTKGICEVNIQSNECTQCSNTTSCSGYNENCICNNHGDAKEKENHEKVGICVPEVHINSACKTTFGDLIECCATNSCPMNQALLLNQESCAYKNCKQFVCQMGNCFRPTGNYNQLNLAQTACSTAFALPKDYTEQCVNSLKPNDSSSMLPSIFFAVFFVVVMIILS